MLMLNGLWASLDGQEDSTSGCDCCHIGVVKGVFDRADLVRGRKGVERPMEGDGHWQTSEHAMYCMRT